MTANLSPEYKDAEARYKKATSFEDKLRALEDMIAWIPKHKGTEKMQADLKTRLARMREEGEQRRKGGGGKSTQLQVDREAEAMAMLLGPPNSGKSSLLAALTNAHPRIASYAFTTRNPNIGVLKLSDAELVLADIPGIIEGASGGAGLGLRFLKHVNRTRALAFLVDLGEADPGRTLRVLEKELKSYNPELLTRPRLVVGTKLDLEGAEGRLEELRRAAGPRQVHAISVWSGQGLEALRAALVGLAGPGGA